MSNENSSLNHYNTELHPTNIEMHPGLHKVMDFMLRELQADELRGVASALAKLAPIMWESFPEKEIKAVRQRYKINPPESVVGGDNELPKD